MSTGCSGICRRLLIILPKWAHRAKKKSYCIQPHGVRVISCTVDGGHVQEHPGRGGVYRKCAGWAWVLGESRGRLSLRALECSLFILEQRRFISYQSETYEAQARKNTRTHSSPDCDMRPIYLSPPIIESTTVARIAHGHPRKKTQIIRFVHIIIEVLIFLVPFVNHHFGG